LLGGVVPAETEATCDRAREDCMATKKPAKKVSVKDLKAKKGGSIKGGAKIKWPDLGGIKGE
jgi:hypothetical protein